VRIEYLASYPTSPPPSSPSRSSSNASHFVLHYIMTSEEQPIVMVGSHSFTIPNIPLMESLNLLDLTKPTNDPIFHEST
jgi:hypothetical protein